MRQDIKELAQDYEKKSAQEVIQWAQDTFKDKVALANSFGAEDAVLTDMVVKINPKTKIFTLDTGRLPQETYEVWDRLQKKYMIKIFPYFPEPDAVEKMVEVHGPNLFYNSIDLRKLCCKVRKIDSLNRALDGLEAWICGLRREQAVTRTEVKKIEVDISHGSIIKINPLADWTEKQVWQYIKKNRVPYNKLHDEGYPSIGCAPCTRAIERGEDTRAGRWWWESPEHKECGLHSRRKSRG